MFSIKTPNKCKSVKLVNTGITPNLYVYNNNVYTNTPLNSGKTCVINDSSYNKQLINEPYNPLKNPLP